MAKIRILTEFQSAISKSWQFVMRDVGSAICPSSVLIKEEEGLVTMSMPHHMPHLPKPPYLLGEASASELRRWSSENIVQRTLHTPNLSWRVLNPPVLTPGWLNGLLGGLRRVVWQGSASIGNAYRYLSIPLHI